MSLISESLPAGQTLRFALAWPSADTASGPRPSLCPVPRLSRTVLRKGVWHAEGPEVDARSEGAEPVPGLLEGGQEGGPAARRGRAPGVVRPPDSVRRRSALPSPDRPPAPTHHAPGTGSRSARPPRKRLPLCPVSQLTKDGGEGTV